MAKATAVTKTKDEIVREYIGKIQERKLDLERASKPNWETGGLFRYSADSAHNVIDIKTVTNIRKLVEVLNFLKERSRGIGEAEAELGLEPENFTWLGFTVDEWKHDLQIRVNQLKMQEKRKELATWEAKLDSMISKELREQMELEELEKFLAK